MLKECVRLLQEEDWAAALVSRFKESEYMITVADDSQYGANLHDALPVRGFKSSRDISLPVRRLQS